jgi:transcription elongation factor Elf1
MAGPSFPGYYRVSCPCGAQLKIDPLRPERKFTCPSCKETSDFIVTMDARSRQPRVSIVVPTKALLAADSLRSAKASRVEASRAPVTGAVATCPCGAPLPVDPDELAEVSTCGACGNVFHVVLKLDPASKRKVAILIPKEGPAPRKPAAPPPPREDAPAPRATRVARPAGRPRPTEPPRGTRVRPKPTAVKPPPGTQAAACPCGHTLFVRRRDVGSEVPCPGCGTTLRLEEARDPQTLAPVVRVRPVN